MKVSTRSKWALACSLYYAVNYSKEVIPLKTVSKALGISEKYLEQLSIPLKKADILASTRGTQGGYKLKYHPEKITVYQVLSSIEPIHFGEDASDQAGEKELLSVTSEFWDELSQDLIKQLNQITLDDLRNKYYQKSSQGLMYYI
ncbi:RrF2 family transcriptional regulator [Natranaerobius thermophilus]|uniref:Transcriptional regulator, BadM/Rrf2 family n=1 Tax=Natranaerobius thermophilus (strain ATCC BAA-1301 / DSM 18059 / JW/NM-WN-LF) TaxID=457570 RepID=B2A255_NATTJ|nr:Rrf2 family transcriptional regulator [Natranaerobius thermophilus]ACB84860.1 transcriptional regulator, BadM/Rrf2 family [Natranaerobius thermophilus JW/NM-WN-LF]